MNNVDNLHLRALYHVLSMRAKGTLTDVQWKKMLDLEESSFSAMADMPQRHEVVMKRGMSFGVDEVGKLTKIVSSYTIHDPN